MPSSKEWRNRGFMTIFRKNLKGLIVVLVDKKKGKIRWGPVNEGEWMSEPDIENFNVFDDNVASVLPIEEVLWLQENCTCDTKTCGPCSKNRTGIPEEL